jgi:hypothetical protein
MIKVTSPPYYNLELYNGTPKRSKEEWNALYTTIFNAYDGLQTGGHFVINANTRYTICFRTLIGECCDKSIYTKSKSGGILNTFIYG